MSDDRLDRAAVGSMLGLLVHDLRNPASTLSANVDFLAEAAPEDPDAREALDDMRIAIDELARGLEQVAWIAGSLDGRTPFGETPADVATALASHLARVAPDVEFTRAVSDSLVARGGTAAPRMVDVLLANAREHSRGAIAVRVRKDGAFVAIVVEDRGRAIADADRDAAFTIAGQAAIKGRADGRYGRFLGLLAVRSAVESLGGTVVAGGVDGAATFELRLPASE